MRFRLVISFLITYCALASTSVSNGSDKIMVTVNGVRVTERQVESLLTQELKMAVAFGKYPNDIMVHNMRVRAVDEIVERIVIDQRASVKNIVITKEEIDNKIAQIAFDEGMSVDEFLFKALPTNNTSLTDFRERVLVGLKFDKLLELEGGKKSFVVTDKEAEQYYKKNMPKFFQPKRVRAKHILIKYPSPTKNDMADVVEVMGILKKMADKKVDFETLARKYSEDTATAKNGGDMGFFTKESMPKEISEPAFSLKEGQISDVIKMNYGCHLLKVVEIDEGGIPPFEKVKKDIKRWITDERKMLRADGYMQSLLARAKIRWAGGKKPEPIKIQQ